MQEANRKKQGVAPLFATDKYKASNLTKRFFLIIKRHLK